MIDASIEEGESGRKKTLTDEEIMGNAITFMLGGYDTTALVLSYTSYLLALNPHVQEKLQQEIDNYYEENPVYNRFCNLKFPWQLTQLLQDITPYQAVQDLQYLDMVIQESMRLYPADPA